MKKKDSSFCSIVIPTFNALEVTKICIQTVFKNTFYPFELIIVDNASKDGTLEYLKQEYETWDKSAEKDRTLCRNFKIIYNKENLGFSKAINQGIIASQGDYILLLNSDTAVTPWWLNRLIEISKQNSEIGIVQPLSRGNGMLHKMVDMNSHLHPIDAEIELIKSLSTIIHPNTNEVDSLANKLWSIYDLKILNMNAVTGFCMLFPRKTINSVGLFDENFVIGLMEDFDYCRRTKLKGFSIALALGVYIHHYVSATFNTNKISRTLLERKNTEYFHKKWAIIESVTKTDNIKIKLNPNKLNIATFNQYYSILKIKLHHEIKSSLIVDVCFENLENEIQTVQKIFINSLDYRNYDLESPKTHDNKFNFTLNDQSFKSLCKKVLWCILQFKLINYPTSTSITFEFENNDSSESKQALIKRS